MLEKKMIMRGIVFRNANTLWTSFQNIRKSTNISILTCWELDCIAATRAKPPCFWEGPQMLEGSCPQPGQDMCPSLFRICPAPFQSFLFLWSFLSFLPSLSFPLFPAVIVTCKSMLLNCPKHVLLCRETVCSWTDPRLLCLVLASWVLPPCSYKSPCHQRKTHFWPSANPPHFGESENGEFSYSGGGNPAEQAE